MSGVRKKGRENSQGETVPKGGDVWPWSWSLKMSLLDKELRKKHSRQREHHMQRKSLAKHDTLGKYEWLNMAKGKMIKVKW